MLRPLLAQADTDPNATALARDGGRAFVSQSLRPYLVAALLDGLDGPLAGAPAIVVASDDRAARDLAAGPPAWLRPRRVRFYPSRGVAYESHLAPPPHLVGLRVAALDALLESDRRRRAAGRRRLGRSTRREGPRPGAAPARVHAADRRVARPRRVRRRSSSRAGTSASSRSRIAGSSRSAAASSTSTRRPRTARCASSCSTSRSSRCAGSRPSRSARSAKRSEVEIAPAAELAAEHRELAEIAAVEDAEERPDVAELLPVDRFHGVLELAPDTAVVVLAAEEEIAPALADHWHDVTAAFHDRDAHHLYVRPETVIEPRSTPARTCASPRSHPTSRTSSARRRPTSRPARSRRPSRSSRSSCARATARSSPGRGAARASARPTTSRA